MVHEKSLPASCILECFRVEQMRFVDCEMQESKNERGNTLNFNVFHHFSVAARGRCRHISVDFGARDHFL